MPLTLLADSQIDQDCPAGSGHGWTQFATHVANTYAQAPETEADMVELLRPAVHQLYNSMVHDPGYREQFLACPDLIEGDKLTWSANLYDDDTMHGGLLAVYHDKPVPFHDHPHSLGVVLVISGAAAIHYADLVSERNGPGLVDLQISRIRQRLPGEVCWFFESSRNIHRIEALTSKAVMLVVHMPPVSSDQQGFYFPMGEYVPGEGNKLLARRIRSRRPRANTNQFE